MSNTYTTPESKEAATTIAGCVERGVANRLSGIEKRESLRAAIESATQELTRAELLETIWYLAALTENRWYPDA